MAVTVKKMVSKEKTDKKTGAKIPEFKYDKIITPSTGRGGKNDTSEYPTLPELVAHLGGKVEVIKDDKGNSVSDDCLVMYLIEGINAARYQDARFAAVNNADSAAAKVNALVADMAKKFGMSVEEFKAKMA